MTLFETDFIGLRKKKLADYILLLSDCLTQTNQANDRHLYQMYLAGAAVILASLERGIDSTELVQKVENHSRLLSQTWIIDEASYKNFYEAWDKFKKLL